MQSSSIDFIAYRPDGKVVLLAEAKSRRGTSESWAAKLRRNMALSTYFRSLEKSSEEITPNAFELVVLKWLTDISETSQRGLEHDPSLAPLIESGLISSLNDAHIELNGQR
jgi:hypothetical protein